MDRNWVECNYQFLSQTQKEKRPTMKHGEKIIYKKPFFASEEKEDEHDLMYFR